ncbi:MAG TPA: hypothetical protein VM260_03340 [Pirellula sp.]|nr:hypothetical protein [Pirellula sp.]
MKLIELLGDPTWLFDLGLPIQELHGRVSHPERLEWRLGNEYQIPPLSSLNGGKRFAEMSIAWNSDGLFFHSILNTPGGNSSRSEAASVPSKSVLLSLYIDTRWSPGVHRATSYCHRFDFVLKRPTSAQPIARGHGELNPIQRARAAPAAIHPNDIFVASVAIPDGYEIKAYLRSDTLTGYSPEEFQEIGVFYTINDSVFGNQIMARTLQSPYFEDPSVWCRAKLTNSPT